MSQRQPVGSVVIPAHEEAAVLGRCLDELLTGFVPDELDVVVVCNGCTDDTAAIARSYGPAVRVIEQRAASKPAALRAGDTAAEGFPRLYLDADVIVPGSAARAVLERLREGAVAARPPIRYESSAASAPVRSYYRARSRVPAVLGSLWGAGLYGLSEAGRHRFDAWPDVVADDLWVDRHFARSEVEIVDCAPVVVTVPRRSRDLIRVLRRTYRGNAEPAPLADGVASGSGTLGSTVHDLGRLAGMGPRAALDAAMYAAFAIGARLALALAPFARSARGVRWERDDTSRASDVPASVSQPERAPDQDRHASTGSHAVLILQLFALALMVIPSDTVIRSIGAGGYPASLVGTFAFAVFMAATLLGLHDPSQRPHPIRGVLALLWLAVLASYVLMDRSVLSVAETAGADRLLMQLAVVTGVALIAAECLDSLRDTRRVLRALCWGGAFCGLVAALQFWMSLDIASYLRELPGFSLNFDNPGILDREGFNRASGTAIHAIELGVVAGMLLPLAIYLAMSDSASSLWKRWTPVALIALGIPASVSRSGILAATVALAVLIVLMPTPQRVVALCGAALGVVSTFMLAPGLIGTMASFIGAGASDPSVASRVNDYPLVERLVGDAPWLGQGGWTYMPDNLIDVLDNQYLTTAIELGLVGVMALTAFFVVPVAVALVARRRTRDPELRLLCAALAAAALAAGVCSLTFDSLSFPMFVGVYALVIGLTGAAWRLAAPSVVPAPRAGPRALGLESAATSLPPQPAGG